MKRIAFTLAAAAAIALTACQFNRVENTDMEFSTESSVRDEMARRHYDAALMVTTGDTQRVTFLCYGSDTVLFVENVCGKDSAGLDYGSSLRTFLVMDRADGTVDLDSLAGLVLAAPREGHEAELQRFAAWSLHGFRAALEAQNEALEADWNNVQNDMAAAERDLEAAWNELEAVGEAFVEFDTTIVAPGCKAQKGFELLEKKARQLGFNIVEIHHRTGHRGCYFSCTRSFGDTDVCYRRMETLSALAGDEGLAYTVRHHHQDHGQSASCFFTARKQ